MLEKQIELAKQDLIIVNKYVPGYTLYFGKHSLFLAKHGEIIMEGPITVELIALVRRYFEGVISGYLAGVRSIGL